MVRNKRYKCIVCGRMFPEGQGIVLQRGGVTLTFHSKACAVKFFRLMVETIDEGEFKKVARSLVKEFEEALKRREKRKQI
ncbi:hypothetical protein Pyrfu_0967 [Pyrolobus fumarii 1A]|uniref:Uncharacterized protein n=1 Tax=Pyrolobus fumarii (strain DSM 11204 / 1A) TaxID=694429 RepID=G0EEL4_PYRF1|nr:hypothetical protein [Pyrolobus fumarii]AEM38836.1 hypothetical protein Pyrfu_0967 [Pyrolobus fumarii 1A]